MSGMQRPGRITLLATCVASAVLALGCHEPADDADTPPSQVIARPPAAATHPATYVGRDACVSCHEAATQHWQGSHHDLAMQPADESTVLGDFADASFTHFDHTSNFFRRDGDFYVRTDGPDGELHEYKVAYTFGAVPLQQYLVAFPDGRYQVLGLCWDTRLVAEGGQRWFHIYPDEEIAHDDPLHWTALSQNWNYMCAECHSTDLRKNYRPEERRFETTWSEIDVSCEACHGPGSHHASAAEAVARGEAPEDHARTGLAVDLKTRDGGYWAFDPGAATVKRTLPRAERTEIEMCARCHSRRSVLTEEYVHGRPLMDSHRPALLDEHLYHADGQISDEVFVYGSFVQSKMYAAGVTCSDCHDPHGLELLGPGSSLCARCHAPDRFDTPAHHHHEQGTPGADCVACHMPEQTYMVVDPRADHSLRVPRPDLTVTLGTPNACTGCHDDRSAQWSADTVVEWYGSERTDAPHYGEALHAGRVGRPGAREALMALSLDPDAPGIARATAAARLGDFPDPEIVPVVREALADADPLVRMGALATLQALEPGMRLDLAAPLLGDEIRAVRIAAGHQLAAVPAEQMTDAQRSAVEHALDEYRAELRMHADRPDSHLNLGVLNLDLGRLEQAEAAYRRALEIDPAFGPASVNLVDLLRLTGRDDESTEVFEQALRAGPNDATLLHAQGLLLVRQGRLDEALAPLRRAAELEPSSPRYAFVFGVALHSAGQPQLALTILESAHLRNPGDRDLLYALATINLDAGHAEQALEFAGKLVELAPQDPAARQLLQSLQASR